MPLIKLIQGPANFFLFRAGWLHSPLEVAQGVFPHSSVALD